MKIYHGSLEKVDIPETRQPQRTLDYGSGLYATTSYSFPTPTEEWVDFVMKNRMQEGFCHDYDIVYGTVANNRVYAAFALYEGGLIDKRTLIAELRAYKLVDQYLFHTEQSLHTLKFVEAKEVKTR